MSEGVKLSEMSDDRYDPLKLPDFSYLNTPYIYVGLTAEEKRRLLKALEKDVEFRYAVAGLIGLGEVLNELKKLREDFNKFAAEMEMRWEENEKRWEEMEKVGGSR